MKLTEIDALFVLLLQVQPESASWCFFLYLFVLRFRCPVRTADCGGRCRFEPLYKWRTSVVIGMKCVEVRPIGHACFMSHYIKLTPFKAD